MKPHPNRFFLLILTILVSLTVSACLSTPATPLPFPTPNVPPLEDVDASISMWNSGNNTRYAVTIEETIRAETKRYKVIVADGVVRAAQQQVQVDGEWQPPTSLDLETAEKYTVDALIERVRNDVLGLGEVPMDMNVIFDPALGFPAVVTANALPTYNAEGNLQLNRDLGYSLSTNVEVLIEDTMGLNKDPILYITRSGSEFAWCDTLRIFPDGSSIYTDDCRKTLLQLTPPQDQLDRLIELSTSLGKVDETSQENGGTVRLVFYGAGQETPDTSLHTELWNIGSGLAELLSHPIGAGITLLYTQYGQLFGYDMLSSLGQPATINVTKPLHGMLANPDGSLLAYSDEEGLHWLDLSSGDTGLFLGNPTNGFYLPQAWNSEVLLLTRIEGGAVVEWGWTTHADPTWHGIPLPEGSFACHTGVSIHPHAREFVIAVGGDCQTDPGLTLVNMTDGTMRKLIDAQSVPGSGAFTPAWSPDGTWIAFSLNLMDTPENPRRLFLVRADGTEMTPITNNTTGQASHPVWQYSGARIYYALSGADMGEDGIYSYELSGQTSLILAESAHPVSISPTDEFLVISTGTEMKAYLLSLKEVYPVARGIENEEVFFVGWLDERNN